MKKKSMIPDQLWDKAYFSKEAGSFSKTPQRTVQLWTERRALTPDISDTDGSGDRRQYSVLNCIEIGIIRSLSNNRVPFGLIKVIMKELRKEGDLEKFMDEDRGFLAIQFDRDGTLKKGRYAVDMCSDNVKLDGSFIDEWFRATAPEPSEQILIININRIARSVLSNME